MNLYPIYKKYCVFFFFNDPATTEIYTLSLHDALPIWPRREDFKTDREYGTAFHNAMKDLLRPDRKSTRLNSSHRTISYAVFCLKKKKKLHKNNDVHKLKNIRHKIFV